VKTSDDAIGRDAARTKSDPLDSTNDCQRKGESGRTRQEEEEEVGANPFEIALTSTILE
jgi:hypothetical protein